MLAEYTGLDEDHELYRVGKFHITRHVSMRSDPHCCLILLQVQKVVVDRVANMANAIPSIKSAAELTNPPGPGFSRLRCFFFFKYEDPALFHSRCRTWWMEDLQGQCYDMDKEYSRRASALAIPQLTNEINILRDPQQAEERFKLMSLGPDLSGTPMRKVEEDDEESSA